MTTEEKKEGEFDPGCVADIYDKLHAHNFALRAFGTLLKSSGLSYFADEDLDHQNEPKRDIEADNLRWGLSQILDLYLDRQQKIIAEYCDQYHNSDIYIIKMAENRINMFEHGAWPMNTLCETIASLDVVINRDSDLKEKAAELKETCLKYLGIIKQNERADSTRKMAKR